MIVGIGSDLCNIERILSAYEKHGDRFITHIFSDSELKEIFRKDRPTRELACSFAKRFAAKEACSKALGTGMRQGTYWKNMEITHLSSGEPKLKLSGGALKHFQRLTGGNAGNIFVTMTDDYPWAMAFVVIERN